ncbi:MAG: response regulator [Verrucomicrobiae bacterium]|nr:response regulator [Verrucomicrobiae bacterium]
MKKATTTMDAPPERERNPRRRVCVLYAEDDRLTSAAIVRLLTLKGFKVESAANGQEALAKLLSQPAAYDFIITDQAMPLLTGEEWLTRAREGGFSGRVLVYAASLPDALAARLRELGGSESSTRRRACKRSWTRWVSRWELHEPMAVTRKSRASCRAGSKASRATPQRNTPDVADDRWDCGPVHRADSRRFLLAAVSGEAAARAALPSSRKDQRSRLHPAGWRTKPRNQP